MVPITSNLLPRDQQIYKWGKWSRVVTQGHELKTDFRTRTNRKVLIKQKNLEIWIQLEAHSSSRVGLLIFCLHFYKTHVLVPRNSQHSESSHLKVLLKKWSHWTSCPLLSLLETGAAWTRMGEDWMDAIDRKQRDGKVPGCWLWRLHPPRAGLVETRIIYHPAWDS